MNEWMIKWINQLINNSSQATPKPNKGLTDELKTIACMNV